MYQLKFIVDDVQAGPAMLPMGKIPHPTEPFPCRTSGTPSKLNARTVDIFPTLPAP